jgi:glycosyltransferase involved in cell wall biosynthesis
VTESPAGPRVSVIVPARDAAATLERTLASLAGQELDEPFEVIVVDDGSADETPQIAGRHAPLVRLVRNAESGGAGAARNRGALEARAPVLAFTDADCFATPGWLASGLSELARADLVQGRVEPDPTQPRTPFDRTLAVDDHGAFYPTANLFVRRDAFESVGGFRDWVLDHAGDRGSRDRRHSREMRQPIGEDTLFAWNARRLGARSAFAPDAVVHHAVVPGVLLDKMKDHWHWATYMPALARLVPEIRDGAFEHRVFFNVTTARFHLALAGVLASAATGRKGWLIATVPYVRYLAREGRRWGPRGASAYVVGTPLVDAATVAGLLRGSVRSRCLVL